MPMSAAAVEDDDTDAAMPALTKRAAKSRRVRSLGYDWLLGWLLSSSVIVFRVFRAKSLSHFASRPHRQVVENEQYALGRPGIDASRRIKSVYIAIWPALFGQCYLTNDVWQTNRRNNQRRTTGNHNEDWCFSTPGRFRRASPAS